MSRQNLTNTMLECIEHMSQNGGKLFRIPGGRWVSKPDFDGEQVSFGVSTVRGLVERGYAEFTDYRRNRAGRFNVEATIVGGGAK